MVVPLSLQFPAPSQLLAFVWMPLEQLGLAQVVLAPYFWQLPEPSHWPLFPQLSGGSAAQSSSGSVPAVTGVHCPFWPSASNAEQARHGALQSDSQHTPSTQNPLTHSSAVMQVAPLATFLVHTFVSV